MMYASSDTSDGHAVPGRSKRARPSEMIARSATNAQYAMLVTHRRTVSATTTPFTPHPVIGWQMADGRWQMADGRRQANPRSAICHPPFAIYFSRHTSENALEVGRVLADVDHTRARRDHLAHQPRDVRFRLDRRDDDVLLRRVSGDARDRVRVEPRQHRDRDDDAIGVAQRLFASDHAAIEEEDAVAHLPHFR